MRPPVLRQAGTAVVTKMEGLSAPVAEHGDRSGSTANDEQKGENGTHNSVGDE